MFDFLKAQHIITQEEETGTYADAFLQMHDTQTDQPVSREFGHEAHMRDYGDQRIVARNVVGFA
ncbi:hypothetical protein GGQ73_004564 [Rhizobium skierniewicense]|uniref:Uncharacterized protein n=1 Tax=Rhizobium skierniewicense TaxID=984260 RepID=A0A7W6G5I0_9HYPH|nr:hypothetical protein [Rhizobium skierniewicense]MBB3948576.1 hypothetical protein [Rhizobium skierniewicense]